MLLLDFIKDKSGATALEYGLIVTAVSIGVGVVLNLNGEAVVQMFNNIEAAL